MGSNDELKSDAFLEQMKQHLTTDAGKAIVKKTGLVYQMNIAPKKIGFNEVSFTIDLKKGEVKKGAYEEGKADAVFSFKDDDFVKLALGKMNPQIAFMRGAIKIKGSMSAAYKFPSDIFPKPSEM
ncbi:PREDICTED: SCP2 sterol-binding domain-containing protein 1-like [Fragaria vesca subsp. vesca]|uniref:SCP2 sterol-binding domain-containing protein 1-like n=1 Tax=Fragaria vesca subsp. vesca TaxID=101020 RepID=UPI0002C33AD4|nr:PREDICTED: SCP2 sterol-binding domain-containing protein 1-like [Fragaria vesca subsp. vesca]